MATILIDSIAATTSAELERKRSFGHLDYIEKFRAVAIIGIVIPHCRPLIAFDASNSPFNFLQPLITGNTTLFLFISGFLFLHVFADRFEYSSFMWSKICKVFAPYAVVTALLLPIRMMSDAVQFGIIGQDGAVREDIITTYLAALVAGLPETPAIIYLSEQKNGGIRFRTGRC